MNANRDIYLYRNGRRRTHGFYDIDTWVSNYTAPSMAGAKGNQHGLGCVRRPGIYRCGLWFGVDFCLQQRAFSRHVHRGSGILPLKNSVKGGCHANRDIHLHRNGRNYIASLYNANARISNYTAPSLVARKGNQCGFNCVRRPGLDGRGFRLSVGFCLQQRADSRHLYRSGRVLPLRNSVVCSYEGARAV